MAEIKKIAKQQGIDSKPFIDDMQTGDYDHAFETRENQAYQHIFSGYIRIFRPPKAAKKTRL